ncbi:MAG TPA: hypothetical protein VHM24_12790 [Gemmatimonadaceae bacterium]|nr:hypothetical protein [Gemmatimonadaceae bacterium]
MTLNRSIALSCGALLVAGAVITYAARAQAPAKPRVVQVSANTPPSVDRHRAPGGTRAHAPVAAPKAAAPEVLINRETYAYPGMGRRDPFVSLMNTEELRPLLGDLKLVAIAFDPTGRNSVAVLRDMSTKEQYRVKVGQEIGRMRVAAIHEKAVIFGIEEFGYSRQESLAMTDSTKVRTQ